MYLDSPRPRWPLKWLRSSCFLSSLYLKKVASEEGSSRRIRQRGIIPRFCNEIEGSNEVIGRHWGVETYHERGDHDDSLGYLTETELNQWIRCWGSFILLKVDSKKLVSHPLPYFVGGTTSSCTFSFSSLWVNEMVQLGKVRVGVRSSVVGGINVSWGCHWITIEDTFKDEENVSPRASLSQDTKALDSIDICTASAFNTWPRKSKYQRLLT